MFEWLSDVIKQSSFAVALVAAVGGGVLSFVTPCVLPLIPGYLSMISGSSLEELQASGVGRRLLGQVARRSLAFVLGLMVVYVAIGAVGVLVLRNPWLLTFAGVVVIVFGLHLAGVLKLSLLLREKRIQMQRRPPGMIGAFLLGLAFAFGWSGCTGPIAGAILGLAGAQQDIAKGMLLMVAYSLGLGIPLLLSGLAINWFLSFLRRVRGAFRAIELVAGLLLVGIGGYLIYTGIEIFRQV